MTNEVHNKEREPMGDTSVNGDFEIALGFKASEWRALDLSDKSGKSEDWEKALKVFENRIRIRFIKPVQFLIDREEIDNLDTCGFVVLAIDFLIIETLEGFRNGLKSHENKGRKNKKHKNKSRPKKKGSKKLITDFLSTWTEFINCVPKGKDKSDLAEKFYSGGRCALHHSGSTDRIIVRKQNDEMFVSYDNGKIKINRTILHRELTKKFDDYLKELREAGNNDLRMKLKERMDHIARPI